MRVTLGCQGQTTFFPASFLRKSLLFACNVRACSIYLIVSLSLQVIQSLVVVGDISLTSTRVSIGALRIISEIKEM
jgi:hypothetical protein